MNSKSLSDLKNINFKRIESYRDLGECLESWLPSGKTLFCFDVDEVLITSENFFTRARCNFPETFMSRVQEKYPFFKEKDRWEAHLSKHWLTAQRTITESTILDLFSTLHAKNIPVLGLTAMDSGNLGDIVVLEEWRHKMLSELGFKFSTDFECGDIQVQGELRPNSPKVKIHRGIIYASANPKGLILKSFLNQYNFLPEKIVFFDDLEENLKSVEQHLSSHCHLDLYHYTKCKSMEDIWNEELACQIIDKELEDNEVSISNEPVKL